MCSVREEGLTFNSRHIDPLDPCVYCTKHTHISRGSELFGCRLRALCLSGSCVADWFTTSVGCVSNFFIHIKVWSSILRMCSADFSEDMGVFLTTEDSLSDFWSKSIKESHICYLKKSTLSLGCFIHAMYFTEIWQNKREMLDLFLVSYLIQLFKY